MLDLKRRDPRCRRKTGRANGPRNPDQSGDRGISLRNRGITALFARTSSYRQKTTGCSLQETHAFTYVNTQFSCATLFYAGSSSVAQLKRAEMTSVCGIVGYIGSKKVVPLILDGLRRLEYRGYDSAGIAVVDTDGKVQIRRAPGKLHNLEEVIRQSPIDGSYGIGHTRWATHGRPTEENAHPHRDCTGQDRRRPQRDRRKLCRSEAPARKRRPQVRYRNRY